MKGIDMSALFIKDGDRTSYIQYMSGASRKILDEAIRDYAKAHNITILNYGDKKG